MVKRYSLASLCKTSRFEYEFAQSKCKGNVEVFKGDICWAKYEISRT